MANKKKRNLTDAADMGDAYMSIVLNHASKKMLLNLEGFVSRMQLRGMANDQIKNVLLADLREGGIIFGEFNNSVRSAVSGTINVASESSAREVFKEEFGEETNYTWVAVLVNTCPDCLARHGRTESAGTWSLLGEPPSWGSVCDPHCQCTLLPSGIVDRSELKGPIMRVKKELKEDGLKVPKELDDPKTLAERKAVSALGRANA